jgi:hypothetical protein
MSTLTLSAAQDKLLRGSVCEREPLGCQAGGSSVAARATDSMAMAATALP